MNGHHFFTMSIHLLISSVDPGFGCSSLISHSLVRNEHIRSSLTTLTSIAHGRFRLWLQLPAGHQALVDRCQQCSDSRRPEPCYRRRLPLFAASNCSLSGAAWVAREFWRPASADANGSERVLAPSVRRMVFGSMKRCVVLYSLVARINAASSTGSCARPPVLSPGSKQHCGSRSPASSNGFARECDQCEANAPSIRAVAF